MIRCGKYRHFKGNEYVVTEVGIHTETGEEMVVYQALYGEKGCWVRPAAMWQEVVKRENYTGPRFTWVEP